MPETPLSEAAARLHGFDDFVRAIMQEWKVQGLAIAIVKDDEVLLARGFGLRDVDSKQEVTARTLFPIASCTKAFTTASLSILADEGKLDWDAPVRTYLPAFKLYDAFTTEHITPRDLVTHRTGLPRHDLMWYNSTATRQELFERLQYLEPTKDLRALWQYQNLMYMVAGYLAGEVSGASWEDVVQTRIFDRLAMGSSNFSIVKTVQEASDFSHPYKEEKDEVKEIPFYAAQGAVAPAGAIVSSVADMANWLRMHLKRGKYGTEQVVSESQVAQLHAPQMIMPESSKFPETPYVSYAMGWFVEPYRGYPMLYHGGNIDGFSSLTSLFPRENIGVVVLTNMSASSVPEILTYNIFERLLDLDQVPWSERMMKEHLEIKEAGEKGKEKSASDRVPATSPSHPLTAYTGDFEHPGYGVISVTLDGEQLQGTFNNMQFPLTHYHYDIFELKIERFDIDLKVSFTANVKGDIDTLIAPFEVTASDIVFKRVPSKQMQIRSFLEPFAGEYTLMGESLIVALKGESTLFVSVPGQPDYELTPYKGTEFHVRNLSGFSIEFKRDASDAVTEAVLTQPYGMFTAKRT
ncbi:MAG: serine hydrolase [Chloroflexota bacterium]|nr:serine hydrolase [Chloroflexota bacterium]